MRNQGMRARPLCPPSLSVVLALAASLAPSARADEAPQTGFVDEAAAPSPVEPSPPSPSVPPPPTESAPQAIQETQREAADARARRKILILTPTAEASLASTADVVANLVAVKAASYPTLDVMTTTDVVRLMSLEADRQLLGCDDTSCAAEIADAMGANLVVFGDVSRLGSVLIVNLSLFDSDKAEPLGRVVVQSVDERTLPGELDSKIEGLLANLPDVGAASITLTNAPLDEGPAILPWTVAGGGALVFVTGIAVGVVVASIPYLLAWNALNQGESALASAGESPEDVRAAEDAYVASQKNYAFAQSLEAPLLAVSAALFAVSAGGLAAGVGGTFWALSSGADE